MPQVIFPEIHSMTGTHFTRNSLQDHSSLLVAPSEDKFMHYSMSLPTLENNLVSAMPEHYGTRILDYTKSRTFVCACFTSTPVVLPAYTEGQKANLKKCKHTFVKRIFLPFLVSIAEKVVE